MDKPIGISFEMADSEDGKRHWYFGKQKLLHVRPTYIKEVENADGSIAEIETNAENGGFKFDLNIGTICRPIPRFWKKEYRSKDYIVKEPATNPWNSGNHVKLWNWLPFVQEHVLRIPISIGFFFSIYITIGKYKPGFYFGFKTYVIDKISQALGLYNEGDPEVYLHKAPYPLVTAWGKREWSGHTCLCPSGTIRLMMIGT